MLRRSAAASCRAARCDDLSRTAEVNQLAAPAHVWSALFVEDLQRRRAAGHRGRGWPSYVPDETALTVDAAGRAADHGRGRRLRRRRRPTTRRASQETVGATTVEHRRGRQRGLPTARPRQHGPAAGAAAGADAVGRRCSASWWRGCWRDPSTSWRESAAALGRGRFDFEPPRSKIPEVVSIATSLQTSALQLQDSLQRDREFFHHASHVLRTPLTGLRLELEELSLRDDLNDDVRRLRPRCLADAERLDVHRRPSCSSSPARARLVAGAEVSLVTLGSDVAQHWRDQLPESREVRAYVDGGADVTADTRTGGAAARQRAARRHATTATGAVTLRFVGQEEHVKVTVSSGPGRAGATQRPGAGGDATRSPRCWAVAARATPPSGGLEILLAVGPLKLYARYPVRGVGWTRWPGRGHDRVGSVHVLDSRSRECRRTLSEPRPCPGAHRYLAAPTPARAPLVLSRGLRAARHPGLALSRCPPRSACRTPP